MLHGMGDYKMREEGEEEEQLMCTENCHHKTYCT